MNCGAQKIPSHALEGDFFGFMMVEIQACASATFRRFCWKWPEGTTAIGKKAKQENPMCQLQGMARVKGTQSLCGGEGAERERPQCEMQ